MAMQQLLLSDDYLSDSDIKRLLMEETPFGGSNNVHESGLMSNQLVVDMPNIQHLNYQNGCIPPHQNQNQDLPMPILGQLGLSHKVTKYQKTICSSSNRVNNCRANGILPMQAQPILCHSDLLVTEVVRDHFLTMISTREHISISNHHAVFANQTSLKNMNPVIVNQVPQAVTKSELLHHQNPTKGLRHGGVASSLFHVLFPESNGQSDDPNSRGLRMSKSEINQMKALTPVEQAVPDHLDKNHYPHACVKCGEVFITTQCYTAHVMSHYQSERVAKNLKRQTSKYKESLHLVQSDYGMASVPGQSLKMTGIGHKVSFKGHRGRKLKMVVKTEAAVKKKQIDVQMAMKQESPYRGVVIKEEPN